MSSRKKLSVEDQIVYRKFRNRQDITYIAEQVCVTEDFARNVILEELLRRYGALEISSTNRYAHVYIPLKQHASLINLIIYSLSFRAK